MDKSVNINANIAFFLKIYVNIFAQFLKKEI